MPRSGITGWGLGLSIMAALAACQSPSFVQVRPDTSRPTVAAARPGFPYGLGGKLTGLTAMTDGQDLRWGSSPRPSQVDLRPGCTAIGNQGQTQACSAFATVDGLAEFLARKQGRPADYAPRFIWNLVRSQTGELSQNAGIDYREAMKAIASKGLVPENVYPFPGLDEQSDPALFLRWFGAAPSADLIRQAKQHRPFQEVQTIESAEAMKQSLANGLPVVFGILAFESIGHSTGPIPLPKKNEAQLGGHILLAVGYDDSRKHVIVRNSWGPEWGDRGYGYLPYGYVRGGWVHIGATAKP